METYTSLKDLNLGTKNGYIKVRLTREWEGKFISKNYIFLDEEGTQIQAAPVQNSLVPHLNDKLKVGKVHVISNYIVAGAYKAYRPVRGEYIINLHRGTKAKQIDDIPTIPRYKFQMIKFEETSTKHGEITNLMDIAGKLIKTTAIQTIKGGKKTVDILLANERDDTIKITLWENQAQAFLQFSAEYSKPNVFVIVTSTSAKSMEGKTVLWSSDSTQYFFNIDYPDLVELRNNCKLDENIIPAIVPFVNTQKQTPAKTIERVEIIQLFDAELPDGESSILYTVEATIVGLLATKTDPWFYTGCDKCYTKFKNSPICTSCPITTTPIPLFRVTTEVRDSTSTTTFILFERHVRKLITVSAQHVLTNDKNTKPNIIPAVVNNMLGKRCVFKLKLTSKNTEEKLEGYTVSDVQEIAAEEHHSATSEIVNPNAKVHHDNAEPNDHVEKKRKIATEDNS